MKKVTKYLILLYIIFVIVKILLSSFIDVPGPYSDYYVYNEMARSFITSGTFDIHGIPSHQNPPLYPIFISLAYLFKDMTVVFFFIKVINSILSSLIIFPAFLLAKEFLNDKKSLLFAILVSVIPTNLSFAQYIMSENLFYTLFLFSIYFLYKSYISKDYKFDVLAGLFIGLTILTRLIGVILIPTFLLSALIYAILNKKLEIKKRSVVFLTLTLAGLPWIFRNGLNFGFKLDGVLASPQVYEATAFTKVYSLESFATLFIFYIAYLIISTGFFPFILNLKLIKNIFKKSNINYFLIISFSAILSSLVIMANHNSGRLNIFPTLFFWFSGKIIGRYADMVLPLIFLNAFIVIFLYKFYLKNLKYPLIITSLVILFSSQIIFIALLPTNNLTLSWVGFSNLAINYFFYGKLIVERFFSWPSLIILTAVFLGLIYFAKYLIKNIDLKKVLVFLVFFFVVVSVSNYAYNYSYNNIYWTNSEQTKLGQWFNEYDKDQTSNVLFDVRDNGPINKNQQESIYSGNAELQTSTIIGFWMNDNIVIDDVENVENIDYIVSKHELDYSILYETNNGIYLYKIKS